MKCYKISPLTIATTLMQGALVLPTNAVAKTYTLDEIIEIILSLTDSKDEATTTTLEIDPNTGTGGGGG